MSEEFIPHIFDAFSQEDSSVTTKYGSTGLGMSITKSLVELMNGQIDVQSKKGHGTTFTITLVMGDVDGAENMSADENKISIEDADMAMSAESAAELAEADVQADLKGKRILVAEDVQVNAEIMKMLLTMEGMESESADNGKIAVQKFEESEPGYFDAVLMDMRMPEMDGLEATRIIRALDREDAKTIPIVALTANAFDEDVQRSIQAGLNAHLSKPVEPELLYETLRKLIRTKQ
jgi:CheY-like chemotaxis protein